MKKIEQGVSFYRPIRIGENIYGSKSDFKRGNFDNLIELLGPSVLKNKTTVDLGAGAGGLSFALVNVGVKHAVSVEKGNRSNLGKEMAKQYNITKIDFRNESINDFFEKNNEHFDFIFLLNLIHWLENPKDVLKQVYDCCNKYIIIETPSTVIKVHTNDYVTDTHLNYFKGCDIKKYPRPNSCDGPRDGLIINVEKYKTDKILSARSKSGSGGLMYRNIDDIIIVYEGKDKKNHIHSIKCRFGGICDVNTKNVRNYAKWYMGGRSDKVINKYRNDMQRGNIFPPILVYKHDNHYHVIDGSHRLEARKGYFKTINAIVLGVIS